MTPLTVCIGYDRGEKVAFQVLVHSLIARSSRVLNIIPLYRPALESIYSRQRQDSESTEFSFTRFLTPYLAGPGPSIFMDCDMLCLTDISKIVDNLPITFDVAVVKHDYRPKTTFKFLGNKQQTYPKKLWSALMVFNGSASSCQNLTPQYVNNATGKQLHEFEWVHDENRIIGLDESWQFIPNHSEGSPRIIHWTEGGPWFKQYRQTPYADLWQRELKDSISCAQQSTMLDGQAETYVDAA